MRKGDLKEGRQRKPQTRERIDEKKNFVVEYFDVVLFMKQKQIRNTKKERDKNKDPKESK